MNSSCHLSYSFSKIDHGPGYRDCHVLALPLFHVDDFPKEEDNDEETVEWSYARILFNFILYRILDGFDIKY